MDTDVKLLQQMNSAFETAVKKNDAISFKDRDCIREHLRQIDEVLRSY
jgi:hypothetical protein